MKPTVVDAGPIIHLSQIGFLKLIRYIPSIIIPRSVIKEIDKESKRSIKKWPNIKIISVKISREFSKLTAPMNLHCPDRDVLFLAYQKQGVILTDDLKLRKAAQKLDIEVHGSIGIIAWGYRERIISLNEGEDALNSLYFKSSLFIAYAIIEESIQHLKKYKF